MAFIMRVVPDESGYTLTYSDITGASYSTQSSRSISSVTFPCEVSASSGGVLEVYTDGSYDSSLSGGRSVTLYGGEYDSNIEIRGIFEDDSGGGSTSGDWELTEGREVTDLSDNYSFTYTLDNYECYRFDFSCAASGEVLIYTSLSNVDTTGYLCEYGEGFDGEEGEPTDWIETDDDSGTGDNFRIYADVEAGVMYSLFVRGYDGDESGKTRINIEPPIAPSTLIISNMVIGSNPTFSFTKFNSEVTDTVTYSFNGLTGTILSNSSVNTYSGWTVPTSFYEKIPNAASGTCTITCKSYYDDVLVGTTTYTVTVSVGQGCNPVLTPVVKDVKPETVALTGDENIIVKEISQVEYAINAVAQNASTIVSQSIKNGSQENNLPNGIINEPETGIFTVSATDSRGLITTIDVEKPLVEYLKPTCYQKIKMEMSGEAEVNVYGSIFAGSFGAVQNSIKIEVRHTNDDGTMGEWADLSALKPEMNSDNSYNFTFSVSGLDYTKAYTFQCRVTDKLYSVESLSYRVRWLPVFDWGEDDFNFNVPVNIGADTLDFYNNTVIRYNKDSDDAILSAGGGHIYIRPGGTDSTYNQTIFYPDGSVDFSGKVMINGVEIGVPDDSEEIPVAADYIVDTGTASMGTNGTWYWEKWNSGKAVCWGKRNFGSMAITTKKVDDVYRSASLSQSFPSGLFNAAPNHMDIRTSPNGYSNYQYCWIGTDGTTAASASSTGTFCVMSCLSTTATASDITFHIIGRWK